MNDPASLAADLRAGVVASTVTSGLGAKKRDGTPLSAADVFPSLVEERPKRGWKAAKSRLALYFAMSNAAFDQGAKVRAPKRRA